MPRTLPVTDEFMKRIFALRSDLSVRDFDELTGLNAGTIGNKERKESPGEYIMARLLLKRACNEKTGLFWTRAVAWNRMEISKDWIKHSALEGIRRDVCERNFPVESVRRILTEFPDWRESLAHPLDALSEEIGQDHSKKLDAGEAVLSGSPVASNDDKPNPGAPVESPLDGSPTFDAVLDQLSRSNAKKWKLARQDSADLDKVKHYVEPHYSVVKPGGDRFVPVRNLISDDLHELGEAASELVTLLLQWNRIWLTDDAGAGKTILTRRLPAFLDTGDARSILFDGAPCLAVRFGRGGIPWPDFACSLQETLEESLKASLAKFLPKSKTQAADIQAVIAHAIKKGRVVLIFDAADQLRRKSILENMEEWLGCPENSRCRIVMTSRIYTADEHRTLHNAGAFLRARIDRFDKPQQYEYLRGITIQFPDGERTLRQQRAENESVEDFFTNALRELLPFYDDIKNLLSIPVVLSLLRTLSADSVREPLSNTLASRADFYLEVHERLIRRNADNVHIKHDAKDRIRWRSILAAVAFEMMVDENWDNVVEGDDAVVALEAKAAFRTNRDLESSEWADDWQHLQKASNLTIRGIVDEFSKGMFGFSHRGMMEFYCGIHLITNNEPDWCGDAVFDNESIVPGKFAREKSAADPEWYWAWRFACEIRSDQDVADERIRAQSLQALFQQPTERRRPAELMWRAWGPLGNTETGTRVIEIFQSEHAALVGKGNDAAGQLVPDIDSSSIYEHPEQKNFTRCPLDPRYDHQEFWMGSDDFFSESPRHKTTVAPFALQTTAVTREQFALFDNNYEEVEARSLKQNAPKPECPAVEISWYDAWCFCLWVGGRLPTEREWEYACRARRDGEEFAFHFGATLSTDQANFRPRERDRFQFDGSTEYREQTVPVRSFDPNAWGLWQMHGNVSEWCEDWYEATAYQNQSATRDASPENIAQDQSVPSDNRPHECLYRVLRGGSWCLYATYCRSAYRFSYPPDSRFNVTGLRVCIDM